MSSTDPWGEFDTPSEYVKFETPGDTVTGIVSEIRRHTWDDGSASPQVVFADGRSVTAGQVQLKALLASQRPLPGDELTITFTGIEPRPGGKTLKLFDVTVQRAGSADAATPAATPEALAAAKALLGEQGLA